MKGHDFKRWRKSLDLSQREAADQLGLKRRVVQYYEKGERDGQSVKIPRTVRLACYALSIGVPDYQGPEKVKEPEKVKGRGKDLEKAAGEKSPKKEKAAKSKSAKAGDKAKERSTIRVRDHGEDRSREWVVAAGVSTKGSKKQKELGKTAKARAKSPGRGNGHDGPTEDSLD